MLNLKVLLLTCLLLPGCTLFEIEALEEADNVIEETEKDLRNEPRADAPEPRADAPATFPYRKK